MTSVVTARGTSFGPAGAGAVRGWCAAVLAVALLVAALALPSSAGAALSVVPQGFPAGFAADTSTSQAGAPADAVTSFTVTRDSPTPWPGADFAAGETGGLLRDVVVDLPGGFNGNAQAVPQCAELIDLSACPIASQVGLVDIKGVIILAPDFELHNRLVLPLYNLTPSFGEVARLGSFSAQIGMQLSVTLSPDDSGVRVEARRLSSAFALVSASLTVWGLPGDPSHDIQRCRFPTPLPLSDDFDTVPFCDGASGDPDQQPQPFDGDPQPFFVNGTSCAEPRVTTIAVSGWADPSHFETEQATAPPLTGCDHVPFGAHISVQTDSNEPDAPTGVDVKMAVPAGG